MPGFAELRPEGRGNGPTQADGNNTSAIRLGESAAVPVGAEHTTARKICGYRAAGRPLPISGIASGSAPAPKPQNPGIAAGARLRSFDRPFGETPGKGTACRARTSWRRGRACTIVILALAAMPLVGATVSGVVTNRTTGKPEPRVALTLISFAQGMDPVEEVYSGPDGKFEFAKEVPGMGMVRTDHQGVTYSTMLSPNVDRANVAVDIYEAVDKPPVAPMGRVLVLEPGGTEMVVNESYLFENSTDPPVTYREAERGSLRFYLPAAAKGIVQVEASGPARMPLNAVAEKTEDPEIYKIDFPIKPGENRISLTYLVPQTDGQPFTSKSVYPDLQTRVAIPNGVEVQGEDLTDLGTEPSTQAKIYEIGGGGDFTITITGAGRLRGRSAEESAGAAPPGEGPGEITIEPAGIHKELPWILGIAIAILALGFFNLYRAKSAAPPSSASAAPPSRRKR